MLKRLLVCLFLLTAASRAGAVDYTDIYFLATESGYGFNVVQSDNFLFVTFFIYGPDKRPTWYTAQLTDDGTGNFAGPLLATTGTYYAMPWNPSDHPDPTQVGTASFKPTSPYTARFIYTVTSPQALAGTYNKELQRQTLKAIRLGGTYIGAQSGTYSGCTKSTDNGSYSDFYSLEVTQTVGGNVSMTFTYQNLSCTFAGALTQFGQLYKIATATYQCSDGLNTNASMAEIKATPLGIEGRFAAPMEPLTGCREDATFGGPRH